MISPPTHPDSEARIIRSILCRPHLMVMVPLLEAQDFWDLALRLVWVSAVMVTNPQSNTVMAKIRGESWGGPPQSQTEMLLACSKWMLSEPGADPANYYGMIAAELVDGGARLNNRPRILRKGITSPDDDTPDAAIARKLASDAKVIRFARRARDQMMSNSHPTISRGQW